MKKYILSTEVEGGRRVSEYPTINDAIKGAYENKEQGETPLRIALSGRTIINKEDLATRIEKYKETLRREENQNGGEED